MSFFFLGLTFCFYGLSHWCARGTQPNAQLLRLKQKKYLGSESEFKTQLKGILASQTHLELVESKNNYILINEKAGWLSYGYFHHITWQAQAGFVLVNFSTQAKLFEHKSRRQDIPPLFIQSLKLKDVG